VYGKGKFGFGPHRVGQLRGVCGASYISGVECRACE
jgi:hypothetical protein